jgi:hypothetical protein
VRIQGKTKQGHTEASQEFHSQLLFTSLILFFTTIYSIRPKWSGR